MVFYGRLGQHELCGVCKKGGDLVLCDGCPTSFHKECVYDTSAPQEKWLCIYCRNSMECVVQHLGFDTIEQIAKRAYDFNTVGFSDKIVLVCDKLDFFPKPFSIPCEREYHIGYLREHKKIDLKELPFGN
ncbi:unnamed protein product [Lactuca virosa]|uniref:PHD-type domain-containing protein n=1 Tax=Lactuca virosa TaxID=75947 RepID=A0AAU9MFF7_9ASTR|nr:unnamed protein product [Lactuca virosa]